MDQRLAYLLNQSNDIFCVAGNTGDIKSTNASWRYFTGYTENESQGKNLVDLAHPDDRNRFTELLSSINRLRNINDFAVRIKTAANLYITVNWTFSFDSDEQLLYACGTCTAENLNIRNAQNISDKVQHVLANLTEGFFMLDRNWRINAFNPAFQKMLRKPEAELYGADFRLLESMAVEEEILPAFESVFSNQIAKSLQYYDKNCKGWLRINIYAYKDELIVFVRDISYIKIEQLILELEKKVLVLSFIPEYTLARMAHELLVGIERIFPEMYCSILELDSEQEKVYHLAAPRLPANYCEAINGSAIGPDAGSCGTAAYHREQVIVSDIANSRLWDNYKDLILPYGFKACWSTPVISGRSAKVLATFAIYYDTIREPGKDELRMIERTVNLIRTLIENKRNEEHLLDQTRRLQDIAAISSHHIRRPVATIMGLVNLFDKKNTANPLNKDIIEHLETTALELDDVIHVIVEKTINIDH